MGGWGVLEKWAVGGGQLLYLFLVSNLLPLLLQIVWHCVQTATVSKVFLSSPLGKLGSLGWHGQDKENGKVGGENGGETHTACRAESWLICRHQQ